MLDSRYLPPDAIHSTSTSLLRDLRADEPAAWQEVFYLYGPIIRFWITRGGVKGSADAADIIQEVFLAVSKNISKFQRAEGRAKFRAWLKAVTGSKVADHFRRKQKRPDAIGGSTANTLLNMEPESSAEEQALTPSEESALVHRAMTMIEGEFREGTWQSFQRTAIDGLPAPDAARELNISSAAVRKNKSRVLRRLREVLEDAGLGDCL